MPFDLTHWRTTLFGFLSRVCMGFILASIMQPEMIDHLFGSSSNRIKDVCALLYFIFGYIKDSQAADKKVVEKNIAQTQENKNDIRDLQP